MIERRGISAGGIVGALVVDAVLVVGFAVVGRMSHAEGLTLAGVWGTAWPFLAGLAVGWAGARAWRHPLDVWPTGVVIWVATLAVGMLLRFAGGQGTAVAFIIVATLTLGLFLVGSRGLATLMRRQPTARR